MPSASDPREDEYNAYVILDLDPAAPWNQGKYDTALTAKKAKWALDVNKPGKEKVQADIKLKEVKRIMMVMSNPALRNQEADAAKNYLQKRGIEHRKQFERELELAQLKKYVTNAEINAWATRYHDVLTLDGVRGLIKVPIQADEEPVAPAVARPPMLDTSLAKDIADKLSIAKEATLYTLLKKSAADSIKDLVDAADALYTATHQQGAHDPIVAEKNNLAGKARAVFLTEESKARYDATLHYQPFDALFDEFYKVCETTHTMSAEQVAKFLQEAVKLGWDVDKANAELKGLAARKKLRLLDPTQETLTAIKELVRCVWDNTLNDPEAVYCSVCGQSLRVICPRCSHQAKSDALNCPNCGFPVGNRFYTRWLLDDAEQRAAARDWPGVQEQLDQARINWPLDRAHGKTDALTDRIDALTKPYTQWMLDQADHLFQASDWSGAATWLANAHTTWPPQPGVADDLTQRMQALDAALATKQDEIRIGREIKEREEADRLRREEEARNAALQNLKAARAALDLAVTDKRFFAAHDKLPEIERALKHEALGDDLRNTAHAELAATRTLIGDSIERVERMLRDARRAQPELTSDLMARVCVAALAICDDFDEARRTLDDLPVSPPSDLKVMWPGEKVTLTWPNDEVTLTWTASPTPGVEGYRVVRALQRAPQSAGDGTRSNIEHECKHVDYFPEIGVSQFYGVYAMRRGKESTLVTSPDPILLAANVTNIVGMIDDRKVELSWTPPPRVSGALFVRNEQATPPPHDDDKQFTASGSHFSDSGLVNGVTYYYTIYARYLDHKGQPVYSSGVSLARTPSSIPAVPTLPAILPPQRDFGYQQTYIPLPKSSAGSILIVKREEAAPLVTDLRQVAFEDLHRRVGFDLRETEHHGQQVAYDTWFRPGACWYIPVIKLNEVAIIGQGKLYVALYDVTSLRAQLAGNDIDLYWQWPDMYDRTVYCDGVDIWAHDSRLPIDASHAQVKHMEPFQMSASEGHFRLPVPRTNNLYIVMRATYTQDGQSLVSAGVQAQARVRGKTTLEFALV